jgi:hypothetical protein
MKILIFTFIVSLRLDIERQYPSGLVESLRALGYIYLILGLPGRILDQFYCYLTVYHQ